MVAIIGALVSVGIASATYYLTRNKEINANVHMKCLERYDDLLRALTSFVKDSVDQNIRQELILVYYRAGAYASTDVLLSCYKLLKSIEKTAPGTRWVIDEK